MSFRLEIEFAGLCVYVLDNANGRVGVLMPDCRAGAEGEGQPDGDKRTRPHVGYIRADLANFGVDVPPARRNVDENAQEPEDEIPPHEVVHLDRKSTRLSSGHV